MKSCAPNDSRRNDGSDRLAPQAQSNNEKRAVQQSVEQPFYRNIRARTGLVSDRLLQRETNRTEIQNTVLATGRRRLSRRESAL